jgi:hypothetical protein
VQVRSFAAGLFLVTFFVFLPTLNLGTWLERVLFDEDGFVSTADGALDQPEVQQAVAERFADRIVDQLDIEGVTSRVLTEVRGEAGGEGSPLSAALLAAPVELGAREFLVNASLAVMETEVLRPAADAALRATHRAITKIISDSDLLSISGGKVVIDLPEHLEQVLADVGGEGADGSSSGLELSKDAGEIVVIDESGGALLWWIATSADDLLIVFAVITVASAMAAVAFSRNRPRMVVLLGVATVAATLLLLAVNPIVRNVATAAAEDETGRAAMGAIYDEMLRTLYRQSIVVLAGGGVLVVAGSAVRGRWGTGSADPAQVRSHVHALRVGGLAVAITALLIWPQRLGGTIIAVGLLLAAYLALIEVLVSRAPWAQSTRIWFADRLEAAATQASDVGAPASVNGWVRAHGPQLRWAGAAGVILLLALIGLPALGAGALVAVTVLALLYFVAIELLSSSAGDAGDAGDASGPGDPGPTPL